MNAAKGVCEYGIQKTCQGFAMRKQTALDLMLLTGFLILLSYTQLPRIVHEIVGTGMLFGIGMHLVYAKEWLRGFMHGRWNVQRAFGALLNALLAVNIGIIFVTGVIASNYLFTDIIPFELHRNLMLRQLHTVLGWLLPALIGLHIGLHGTMLWQRFTRRFGIDRTRLRTRFICGVLSFAIIALGICSVMLNRIGDRLRMEHIFATEATTLPGGVFVLLVLAMIGMCAIIGTGLMALLRR